MAKVKVPTTGIWNGPMVTDMLIKQLIEEQRIVMEILIEIRKNTEPA